MEIPITDWLIAFGTWATAICTFFLAFATLVLAFVAAFQDRIRRYLFRPRLRVTLNPFAPHCHKTVLESNIEVYYFRLWVENREKAPAENVEVFLKELKFKSPNGTWESTEKFLPMNLKWSHWREPFLERLSYGLPKHCDLAHIVDPAKRSQLPREIGQGFDPAKTVLSLDLIVRPPAMGHLYLWPPGTYQMLVVAGASNADPVETTIQFTVTGDWFADEKEMLEKGLIIKQI